MEPITAYHVVTDRPMTVGQHIIFDKTHHSGVYSRVMALADTAADVYAHPEKYELPLEHHLDVLSNQRLNVSSDDDSSILAMVAQGLGVTAMPWLSLRNLPENLRVLELDPVPHRVLGVALPKIPTKAAANFAAFLKKQYPYPKK